MEFFRELQEDLISEICESDIYGAFELYKLYHHLIEDYKIILANPNGSIIPGYAINRKFSDGAAVQSPFKSEKVLVLDKKTLQEMETGRSEFQIDYSISLDTQALSYLEPYISPLISKSRIPHDFEDVFAFMARKDVNVDPQPYIVENIQNLRNPKNYGKIYKKLQAYETLRTINIDAFSKDKVICSTLTNNELMIKTDEHFNNILNNYNDLNMRGIYQVYNLGYICLLKMAIIQLKQSANNEMKKMEQFLDFCDDYLATIPLRDTVTAHKFFKEGSNFKFFNRIQKGNEKLIPTLKGMAWDVYHIRSLEDLFRTMDSKISRYFFPSLLSFDKGLIELMQLYPLRAIAFNSEGALYPFFDGDFKQYIEKSLLERVFSDSAKDSRNNRRNKITKLNRVNELIISLETELMS